MAGPARALRFTNFLFFDNFAASNLSGLLDQYAPDRVPASPNETFAQYKRPVCDTWKNFR